MRLIGLTGGIATGKSTVASLLRGRGAVVVDADVLAREVVAPGEPAFDEITEYFGSAVIGAHGELDRAALAALVFADPAARRHLEAITHTRIGELMAARLAEGLAGTAPLVVADIPLLFENDRDTLFEGTLLVYAPPEVQLARLASRDGLDTDAARARLAAQLPIDEKRARATWVIDNGGSREVTARAVEQWWTEVTGSR